MKNGDLLNTFATGTKRRQVVVVINPELGYDNVICIAESIKAAEFYLDTTVERMKENRLILRFLPLQTQTEE